MKKSLLILGLVLVVATQTFAAEIKKRNFKTEDGQTIHYFVAGDSKKMAVVLVHGFPFSSKMWDSQVQALKNDYYVITYDLRGAGVNKVSKHPFTMEILVDDFFALLEKEKLENPIVVGFSMGGFLALRAQERQPEKFKALVLADTKSTADSNESKIKRTDAIKIVGDQGLAAYADVFLKAGLAKSTFENKPDLVNKLKEQAVKDNSVSGVISSIFALISRTDTTSSLANIHIPTLILVGDQDTVTSVSSAQDMQKAIKGSELKIIPQAGHLSPVENSEAFNKELISFLSAVKK